MVWQQTEIDDDVGTDGLGCVSATTRDVPHGLVYFLAGVEVRAALRMRLYGWAVTDLSRHG